jgi:aminoglycoside phosphotransferase (APT) family kinase protein
VLTLVGKSDADEPGQQTFQIMRELNRSLGQQPDQTDVGVPQALFYDPKLHLLAQQRITGVGYAELQGRSDFLQYLRLAGQALSRLHRQPIGAGPETWLPDHLADLIQPHPTSLCEQMPAYRSQLEALISTMRAQERSWKHNIEIGPIHRNFHLHNLFYAQGRVWVVDWDLFAQGDPALDVGTFIVYLQTQLGERRRSSIGAFIDGYFHERPLLLLERVPLYAALTYLRLASVCFRMKEPGWEDQFRDLLSRGEECLVKFTIA